MNLVKYDIQLEGIKIKIRNLEPSTISSLRITSQTMPFMTILSCYYIQLWTSVEVNIRFYGPDRLYMNKARSVPENLMLTETEVHNCFVPWKKKNCIYMKSMFSRISVNDVMFEYLFYTSKSSIQYLGCQCHKLSFLCWQRLFTWQS